MLLKAKTLKNWEKYNESRGDSRLWERGSSWVLRTMNKYEKLECSQVNHKNGSSCIFASYLVMLLLCHHLAFSSGELKHCQVPWKVISIYNNPQAEPRVIPLCMQYQQPSQPSLYLGIEIIFQDPVSSPPDICSCFLKSSFDPYHIQLKSFQIFSLIAPVHHFCQILPLKCPNMFLNLEDLLVFKKETCKVSYQGTFLSAVKPYLPTPCGQRSIRYIQISFC